MEHHTVSRTLKGTGCRPSPSPQKHIQTGRGTEPFCLLKGGIHIVPLESELPNQVSGTLDPGLDDNRNPTAKHFYNHVKVQHLRMKNHLPAADWFVPACI